MSAITEAGRGHLVGLGNLTRREVDAWSGRAWYRQALVWSLILGGLLAAMVWLVPALMENTPGAEATTGDVENAALQFPDLAAVVIAVGVVLLTQGILLDERRNGVLEWLLSKPLARPAVVLSKFLGVGAGLVLTVVVVPWIVVHALLSLAAGELWSPGAGMAVAALLALVVAFHLAFVLAVSTVTSSRVLILAVPIVAIVSADGIAGMFPEAFHVLPWSLGALASVLLAEGVLVSAWPIVATAGWTVLLLAMSAVALEREEL